MNQHFFYLRKMCFAMYSLFCSYLYFSALVLTIMQMNFQVSKYSAKCFITLNQNLS